MIGIKILHHDLSPIACANVLSAEMRSRRGQTRALRPSISINILRISCGKLADFPEQAWSPKGLPSNIDQSTTSEPLLSASSLTRCTVPQQIEAELKTLGSGQRKSFASSEVGRPLTA